MLRAFLSFSGAESIAKAINWATLAALPVFLKPAEYGVVGLLVAMEVILSNLTLLGQEKSIFKFNGVAQYNVLHYAIRIAAVTVVLTVIMLVPLYLLTDTISGITVFPAILILLLAVLCQNFARLLMAHSRIQEDMKLFWGTRLLYQILKSGLVLSICALTESGLSYIYASVLAGIAFIFVYRKHLFDAVITQKMWKMDSHYQEILAFGAPLVVHAMSGSILSYADRFFIEKFLDMNTLGVYTFVYALGSSIFFFYGAMSSYFEPLTYRYQHDKMGYRSIQRFYLLFVLLCSSLMAFAIDILFEPVLLSFVSPSYVAGASALKYILAAHLMIPFYTIASHELAVNGGTRYIALTTLLIAVVNLSLNAVLIPTFGLDGAAMATLFTYVSLSILTTLISFRKCGRNSQHLLFVSKVFLWLSLALMVFLADSSVLIWRVIYVPILFILVVSLMLSKGKFMSTISGDQPNA